MGAGTVTDTTNKQALVMEDFVSLRYEEPLAPNLARFAEALLAGRLVGEQCPSCERVFLPGKGFCALCLVETDERHQVEVSDSGVVTGYTIVTPVHYYGQQQTEPFVHASVLLDGADNALSGQQVMGPREEVRAGMRVRAVWRPEAERTVDELTNRGWGGVAGVIEGFEPTGDPDAPFEHFKEHIL
ncbi:MAG: Zn-ribbon domain-containing OB-fold protein [Actinomycetota bacterium]